MKKPSRPDDLVLYGKFEVDSFSNVELLWAINQSRLQLNILKSRPIFSWLATTPISVMELLIVGVKRVLVYSKMIGTKDA